MIKKQEYSLAEVSRLLSESQHRLIYLCEKGVVVPDFGNASGRGSSRRFSARNLLEFAIALKFRELMIPAAIIGAVLYVLRKFETAVKKEMPGFSLPDGLRMKKSPVLRIVFLDGPKLYFQIGPHHGSSKTFGGLDLGQLVSSRQDNREPVKDTLSGFAWTNLEASGDKMLGEIARLEVNVTRIAQNLPLSE